MNFIDLIFINFIVTITILGGLVNFIEPYLPTIITQTFRYGKHAHKGTPNRLAQMCEIPKSYFRHFYVFALFWSVSVWSVVARTYLSGNPVSQVIIWFLDILCGSEREVTSRKKMLFFCILINYKIMYSF